MSRQNKAVKKNKIAAQFTELRKSGSKGPSRTTPKHGKDPAKRLAHNNVDRVGRKVKIEE